MEKIRTGRKDWGSGLDRMKDECQCFNKTWNYIKKYYTIKLDKNKLVEFLIFLVCFYFIGILIYSLKEFAKIIFLNNFDKNLIFIFSILAITSGTIIISILFLVRNKHKGLTPYLLGIYLIFIYLTLPILSIFKILITIFIILISFPLLLENWPKLNLWLIFMVITSLILLFVGFYYIQDSYGEEKRIIFLNECGGSRINGINMTCSSNSQNQLIADSFTIFNINKNYDNIKGNITLKLFNGSNLIKQFNQKIEFNSPSNLIEIQFRMEAREGNVTQCMDSNLKGTLKFYSYEETQKRKEKFNDYLLALFGIVIFSVPIFILNLMKIWREGNK